MKNEHTFIFDESQRQATLLALAHLAVERPGWNYMLTEIAAKMDNLGPGGEPEMFTTFKITCDRKAQADKVNTPLAAGFCMGLTFSDRVKLNEGEKGLLKHAAKILAKVAGVTLIGDEDKPNENKTV